MSYLTVEHLDLELGGKTILDDLHLSVEKGQLVTLLGPSGCGKSTLLRAISGLAPVSRGKVVIDGSDVTDMAAKKRGVGMVFQSYALFPNLTVFDNVAFGLVMKKMNKPEIKSRVDQMLALIGLSDKADIYPQQLSGGQQQRVALARSLVVAPKVLLLDEPLSALDAQIRRQLRVELCRLQRKLAMTMIFVTHDQEEAMTISDRIFVMHDGRIAQEGAPGEIYTHPDNRFVAGFIGNYNTLDRDQMAALFGTSSDADATYALRPETIHFQPQDGAIRVEGTITDRHILGNVIRYTVQTEYGTFRVDCINRGGDDEPQMQHVTLFINEKDIVVLNH